MNSGLGAQVLADNRTLFRVWAPGIEQLELQFSAPEPRRVLLTRDARNYHEALLDGVSAGARYRYRFPNGQLAADPASRYQPEGVHGASEVVDLRYDWTDRDWQPPELNELVMYELHVGTFTRAGTFSAIIDHLDELSALGINALELMPIAQFPGSRNWGYDGVFPFAVQNTYGEPRDLQALVDACHARGLAVILDVVYNHVGPEGNLLGSFGPYFNQRYRTPWGQAINFDAAGSDEVSHFFIENARQWLFDFHIDALRLDAVHAILDLSAYPFLSELADRIAEDAHSQQRRVYLIAESDLNDPRFVRARDQGGHGLHAQWSDDFHHALHTLLTGEAQGYYADFGDIRQLARAYRDAFVYSGQYSPYRQRRHGAPLPETKGQCFIVYGQNHDQVGNRLKGERLSGLVTFEAQKLAAAAVLTSPFVPLLFMGEEFGELAPFPYFVDHTDPVLVEAVRTGRKLEFRSFDWNGEPPDPQADATFASARLNRHLRERSPHRELFSYYQHLIRLRRDLRLNHTDRTALEVVTFADQRALLVLRREHSPAALALLLCFHPEGAQLDVPLPQGLWRVRSDSAAREWAGPGCQRPECLASHGFSTVPMAPWSALVLEAAG